MIDISFIFINKKRHREMTYNSNNKQLFVKTLKGNTLCIYFNEYTTVLQLMKEIEKLTDQKIEYQSLIYVNEKLSKNPIILHLFPYKPLKELGVDDYSSISLVVRLSEKNKKWCKFENYFDLEMIYS